MEKINNDFPKVNPRPPIFTHELDRESLPEILDNQRLVAKDFRYGPEEIEKEILRALNKKPKFRGYPKNGLKMTEEEYKEWTAAGRPKELLVGTPANRPSYFIGGHENRCHPNGSLKNTHVEPYDGTQEFKAGTFGDNVETASDGSPLNPFMKIAVTKSQDGIPTGPGFYWKLGKNHAADPVIMRITDGRLEVLLVWRSDGGGWALPGGMADEKDKALSMSIAMNVVENAIESAAGKKAEIPSPIETSEETATREVGEETGITNLHNTPRVKILENVPVADWRMTAQAWPVTSVYLFMPNQETAAAMVPKAADDAQEAVFKSLGGEISWKGIKSELLFASHANYIKLSILEWERQTGLVVRNDGVIGIKA